MSTQRQWEKTNSLRSAGHGSQNNLGMRGKFQEDIACICNKGQSPEVCRSLNESY